MMKDFAKEYQERGAYHSAARGFFAWWLRDNYRLLARLIRAGDMVLDLACGDGALASYLPPCILIGVDNVAQSLKLNEKNNPDKYHQLVLGDMRALDQCGFPERSFDAIICSLSFMYLERDELKKCLAEIHRLLKDDGTLICSYPSVHKKRSANPEARELPLDELRRIIEETSFRIKNTEYICPLQPRVMVAWSTKPFLRIFAKGYYMASKKFYRTFEDSYHFVLSASPVMLDGLITRSA